MFEINSNTINFTPFVGELDSLGISSFSNEIKGDYALISDLGNIFNFNSLEYQNYGNGLLNHNFDDLPTISISKYDTPLNNGGIIESINFDDFIFNIKFIITSNNIDNLEKELNDIKTVFNSKIKFYKRNRNKSNYINVRITDFKIDKKLLSGTQISASFISVDPFWTEENGSTQFFEGLNGDLDTTLIINDSSHDTNLGIIIQINTITDLVDKISVNLNGYSIEINRTFINGDIVVLEKETGYLFVNGERQTYRGNLLPFPILKPGEFKINFEGGGEVDSYNVYILYDKIVL